MMKFGEQQYSTIDESSETLVQEDVANSVEELSEDFNDTGQNIDTDYIDRGIDQYRAEMSLESREKNAKIWADHYHLRAEEVFSEDGLRYLDKMPAGQRLAILRFASRDDHATPEMFAQYFKYHREDVDILFFTHTPFTEYEVNNGDDFRITSLVAPILVKAHPRLKESLGQYLEIADRRAAMPDFLIDGPNYDERAELFGGASKKYSEIFSIAAQLDMRGDAIIDLTELFGDEFESLNDKKKEEFLRACISDLHNALVATEAYNSLFTKKGIDQDEQRVKNNQYGSYNPAHSIIFKTFQPSKAYEKSSDFYEDDMNSTAMIGGFVEEYPFHRMLIKTLGQFSKYKSDVNKNTDLLVEFWDKNRNPIFANHVAEALTNQNPNRSASKLLEILQDDKTERKNAIAAILYRLEFGRLGISDDGVRYLEKQYDLGELNNPDFFVKRLTAQGDIGIFDDEEILQHYFNIGDIASADQSPVTPEVMAFACDTLFYGSDMDTPDQNKERMHYLQEFKENYFHFYDNTFMERSGIRFNNLSFPEQGEYLIYHKSTTEDQRETLFDFLQRYGENGLRTFLSIEHGGREMGEKILTIGEKYPQEVSDKIFAKYGELVDTANSVESYLEKEFHEADVVTVRQTAENLLLRGKALLSTLADAENLQSEDILLKLERMKDEVFLYTASVKALRDTDEDFKLENLEKDYFEILSGPELTNKGEDVTQHMKDIYLKNYKGEQFTDAFRTAIIESLEKNLSDPQSRFYVLKHQGEIVAFNCFTPQENDTVYFSNFNVDPNYAHARLGAAMMEASLDKETQGATIECTGVSDAPITQTYIERDFKKTGEIDVGGVTLWKLRRENGN